MKINRSKLATTIADLTLKGGPDKKLSREVAAYLISTGNVYELDSIMRDVQSYWAQEGHIEVEAATAHELSSKVKQEITRQVKVIYPKAKSVNINEVKDPEVMGGVRLSLVNQQLDLSLEAKLNKFKVSALSGKD
jgi:F0F1-type ATP synthase delta subunit